jgi:hypothetical protein
LREFGLALELDLHLDRPNRIDPAAEGVAEHRLADEAVRGGFALEVVEARRAFTGSLDGYSPADVVEDWRASLRHLLDSFAATTRAAAA